jgi:TatD DNase family protein
VPHVAEFIATLKGVSQREVAQATTDNFFKLFRVPRD